MDHSGLNENRIPLVSVIISVFNEEKYIRESILSIINQTYKNLEIIIIDDYCTDNSISIIKEFNDTRIVLYQKKFEPRFLASSRNIGITLAKGEYIILHDADDTCSHDRIEKQLSKHRSLNCEAVVGCFVNKIYQNGFISKMVLPIEHKDIIKGFSRATNRVTIVSGTILASTSVFKKFKYSEFLKYAQDWDHMLRMYESNEIKFYNIPETLYNYYQRPKGVMIKPDWPVYNIIIRINQKRRKKKKQELKSLEDFKKYLKHPIRFIFWGTIIQLIKLNVLIKQSPQKTKLKFKIY